MNQSSSPLGPWFVSYAYALRHMVEVIKSAPELVHVGNTLAGVAHARAIAHSKQSATFYYTAKPLFDKSSAEMAVGGLEEGMFKSPAESQKPSAEGESESTQEPQRFSLSQ